MGMRLTIDKLTEFARDQISGAKLNGQSKLAEEILAADVSTPEGVETQRGRVEELKQAFENRDMKDLAFKAHALKGLGGFAGFPVFTEKAKCLEETVKAEDFDSIRKQLDEMVNLCMRTKLQQR